jgi:hypothetical protein
MYCTCAVLPHTANVCPSDSGNTGREKCRAKGNGNKLKYNMELKCTVILAIIGATGIVTESLRKNL